jgi:hypothetical protein
MTAVHALRAVAIAHRSAAPIAAPARPPAVPRSRLREGFNAAGDMLALLAIAFSLPFIILAVGTPIAVALMALLWIIRSL